MMRVSIFALLVALALFAAVAHAHVSAVPNDNGIIGSYNFVSMRIPHASSGFSAVRVTFKMPGGVVGAKAQKKIGWRSTVEMCEAGTPGCPLAACYDRYGAEVCMGPSAIVFESTGEEYALPNTLVGFFGLQIKIGCNLNLPESNSFYTNPMGDEGLYVWINTVQEMAPDGSATVDNIDPSVTLNWAAIPEDGQPWNKALPKPSPFLRVRDWTSKCPDGALLAGEALEPQGMGEIALVSNGVIAMLQETNAQNTEMIVTMAAKIQALECQQYQWTALLSCRGRRNKQSPRCQDATAKMNMACLAAAGRDESMMMSAGRERGAAAPQTFESAIVAMAAGED